MSILELAKQRQAERAAQHAKIAVPGDPLPRTPTLAEEREIRALLARQCPQDHPDYAEALAIALRDPAAALEALRSPIGGMA